MSDRSRVSTDARTRRPAVSDEERELRRKAHERRERQARLQMGFYAFCLVALVAGYWYAGDFTSSPTIPMGADIRAPDGTPFLAQDVDKDEEPVEGLEMRKSERQRSLVEELARRHVGTVPQRELGDLDVLQQLVDARVLGTDQTFELQALGVTLGDVMASELGLEWVVVNDRYGRSRALRYGLGADYFFPVTMISRRYEAGIVVDVEKLFEDTAIEVAALEASNR